MTTATITGPVYGVSQTWDFISMSIVFELSHWDRQEDIGVFASGPIVVEVDENGDFSVDLMVNDDGENFTHYQCFLQYRRTDGTEWIREPIGVFSLASTGTYKLADLEIISVEGVDSSLDVYTALQAALSDISLYNNSLEAVLLELESMGVDLYETEALGLAGTSDGDLFFVVSSGDAFADLYKNVTGSAVSQGVSKASASALDMKVSRDTIQTTAGKSLIVDESDQVILSLNPDGVDFIPSTELKDRLVSKTMIDETWAILADGQSGLGSTASTVDNRLDVRRHNKLIVMPNNGLGVHQISLNNGSMEDGYGNDLSKYPDITDFEPADERVNPKPDGGGGALQSIVVPTAETLLSFLNDNLPQVLVANVGQNGQPLVQESGDTTKIGLHLDEFAAKSEIYDFKMDLIQAAYDIASAQGKPLTRIFITFNWGESVDFTARETVEAQILAYISDTEADIAAISSDIEVVWLFTQVGGNTTRSDYPARLATLDVVDATSNAFMVSPSFYKLTDSVHPTNRSKCWMGSLYGYAAASIVASGVWDHPTFTFNEGSEVVTLVSDMPLEKNYELKMGESMDGFTLTSSTATLLSVSLDEGYTITLTFDVAPDTGDILNYAYRNKETGEATAVGQPLGNGPFALLGHKVPSPILPGQTVQPYVPSQTWEFA